jgi:hypothetical protein
MIRAPPGKAVRLRFTNFALEPEGNCEYDFVEVYDGETEASSFFGRYCGTMVCFTTIAHTFKHSLC